MAWLYQAELSEYLFDHDIDFVHDDTNFEDDQDRNFIRNEVLKKLLTDGPMRANKFKKQLI